MKIKSIKFPAFTIFELLIALSVSGILIVIIYQFLRIAIIETEKMNTDKIQSGELIQCLHVLENDIESSEMVIVNDNSIECKYSDRSVWYGFSNYILREQNHRMDTFWIQSSNLKIRYKENEVYSGIADEISFTFGNTDQQIKWSKLKIYSYHVKEIIPE